MKTIKKSHVNVLVYFFVGLIFLSIAFVRQPSLRSIFKINNNKMWQELLNNVGSNDKNLTQDFWQFRDFYSRGEIYLQKNQGIDVPLSISSLVKLPNYFKPYLLFNSPMLLSIEGIISEEDKIFLSEEYINQIGFELTIQTETTQIFTNKNMGNAVIISIFNPETYSLANGYLYFDMRDDLFKESLNNKKWLIVTLVTLK